MITKTRGFTLTELLVVIAIIIILSGILLPAIQMVRGRALVQKAGVDIEVIKTALEQYRNDFGDYPPSTLAEAGWISKKPDNDPNVENEGNEAMLGLLSTRLGGPYIRMGTGSRQPYGNTDKDWDPSNPLISKYWALEDEEHYKEFLDPWGNPYIYFHGKHLKDGESMLYRINGEATLVRPLHDDAGVYYSALKYQLWSFGPNCKNDDGDNDDLTSWSDDSNP